MKVFPGNMLSGFELVHSDLFSTSTQKNWISSRVTGKQTCGMQRHWWKAAGRIRGVVVVVGLRSPCLRFSVVLIMSSKVMSPVCDRQPKTTHWRLLEFKSTFDNCSEDICINGRHRRLLALCNDLCELS